jgi:FixJ family two-component response regulator
VPKGQLDGLRAAAQHYCMMSDGRPLIAVVDDDSSVRKALAHLLTVKSYAANTFGSAKEFLQSLDQQKPNCLVLDLHMPECGGLDLQHHLLRNGIKIPTVIITAHDEIGLRERCSNAGASAFLVKPISVDILINAIDAAMKPH